MNTEIFTGKAQAYANARPGYPDDAIEYICTLAHEKVVFADIGAGTGKFTAFLANRGYELFAVEPNSDMREQLVSTLISFPNATIVNGSAEATTLSLTIAWILSPVLKLCAGSTRTHFVKSAGGLATRVLVIAVYNNTPGDSSIAHSKLSTDVFFKNPAVREFPNPMFYTRESWLQYMTSHSHDPLLSDPGYEAHIAEMNGVFDQENVNGLLRRDVITKVYSERID